jgi:allantoinase
MAVGQGGVPALCAGVAGRIFASGPALLGFGSRRCAGEIAMDAEPYDRVIRGDLVLPDGLLRDGHVAIRGEVIAALGQGAPPPATEVLDYRGHILLPGLVDGHMHTSSALGWAGIEGASRTAAAGGVTTCVDMPYDIPRPVTDAGILAEKIQVVNATSHVDMALYGTILKTGGVDAIAGLAEAGVCSFKLSTNE